MNFEQELHENCVIFRPLNKRLDSIVAPDFRKSLIEFAAEHNLPVVVDLFNVDFMDSSGLGALIGCFKSVQTSGGLSICSVHDDVNSLFSLTHMDRIFEIHDDLSACLTKKAA